MSTWVLARDEYGRPRLWKDGSIWTTLPAEEGFHDVTDRSVIPARCRVYCGHVGFAVWRCSAGDTIEIASPGTYWMPLFFGVNRDGSSYSQQLDNVWVPTGLKGVSLVNTSGGEVRLTMEPISRLVRFGKHSVSDRTHTFGGAKVRLLWPFTRVDGVVFDGAGAPTAGTDDWYGAETAWSFAPDIRTRNTALSEQNTPIELADCKFTGLPIHLGLIHATGCAFESCSGRMAGLRGSWLDRCIVRNCKFSGAAFTCGRASGAWYVDGAFDGYAVVNSFFEDNSFSMCAAVVCGCGFLDNSFGSEGQGVRMLANSYAFGNTGLRAGEAVGCLYGSADDMLCDTPQSCAVVPRPSGMDSAESAVQASLGADYYAYAVSYEVLDNSLADDLLPKCVLKDWNGNDRDPRIMGTGPVYPLSDVSDYNVVTSRVSGGLGSVQPRVAVCPKGGVVHFSTGPWAPGSVLRVAFNGTDLEPSRSVTFRPDGDGEAMFEFSQDMYVSAENGASENDGSEGYPVDSLATALYRLSSWGSGSALGPILNYVTAPVHQDLHPTIRVLDGKIQADVDRKYDNTILSASSGRVKWLVRVPLLGIVAESGCAGGTLYGFCTRTHVLCKDDATAASIRFADDGSPVSVESGETGCVRSKTCRCNGDLVLGKNDTDVPGTTVYSRVTGVLRWASSTTCVRCRVDSFDPVSNTGSTMRECAVTNPPLQSLFFYDVFGLVADGRPGVVRRNGSTNTNTYEAVRKNPSIGYLEDCIVDFADANYEPPELDLSGSRDWGYGTVPNYERARSMLRTIGGISIDPDVHKAKSYALMCYLMYLMRRMGYRDVLQFDRGVRALFSYSGVVGPTWLEVAPAFRSNMYSGSLSGGSSDYGDAMLAYIYGMQAWPPLVHYVARYSRFEPYPDSCYFPRVDSDMLSEAVAQVDGGTYADVFARGDDGTLYFAEKTRELPGSYVSACGRIRELLGLDATMHEFSVGGVPYTGFPVEEPE